ncbi:hypothetical protein AYO44_12200 [Planctomycetaceae bacterium SCGC AG-212-F19]|nr:hypothetical protein AYO44_12200 [Planctomycetaceae bacterium SCGC AG-212-F19]
MLDERLVMATVIGAVSLPDDAAAPEVFSTRVARLVGRFLSAESAAVGPADTLYGSCANGVGFDEPWEEVRRHVPWHVH